MIDLRSDTVTRPSEKMRQAMKDAVVGDDVMGDDPTVQELEEKIARIFNKESALFFPSGTMSNLTAMLSWCSSRGSEIIVGEKSHIFLFEQTGASQFGGISLRTIPNQPDGTMRIEEIQAAIRDDDIHEPSTQLICIENTHNVCGGRILPITFMKELYHIAKERNLPIHMDGARVWNAIAATKTDPKKIGQYVDSLTVCLSKGLGAPVGSLLIGPRTFIQRARRIRKALGGGMRQSGVLAAAGIVSLDDFFEKDMWLLQEDHRRAQQIVSELHHFSFEPPTLEGVLSDNGDTFSALEMRKSVKKNQHDKSEKSWKFMVMEPVDTNIIFIHLLPNMVGDTNDAPAIAPAIASKCKEHGILISVWSNTLIRLVVHRDIKEEDILYIIETLKYVLTEQM